MDNQHRLIKGYNELSQEQIDLINEVKALGAQVEACTDKLRADASIDRRWLAIGITDLQKGFMGVIRSIAKPASF